MKSKQILLLAAVVAIGIIILAVWWRGAAKPRIVIKKRPAASEAARKARPRPSPKTEEFRAKAVIVIDDFGYNVNNLDALFAIGRPVTLSILPNQPYSRRVSEAAVSRGYEVIMHLPLEPHSKDVREEPDTIRAGMSAKEVDERISRQLESVPDADGVSNHMGSKATEDKALMKIVFANLKRRGLFFFDSLTSQKSVCREAARESGIKYARRDFFLDNTNDVAYIKKQLIAFKRLALRRGKAIAICHDRKNTMEALAAMMPQMADEGIEFVSLAEMVR